MPKNKKELENFTIKKVTANKEGTDNSSAHIQIQGTGKMSALSPIQTEDKTVLKGNSNTMKNS